MNTEPSAVDLDQAASDALAALAAQTDAETVARLQRLIVQIAAQCLKLPSNRITVNIKAGVDVIGLAAMPRTGVPVAVSGAKADCIANPRDWVEARCAEITQQFEAKA
jgi:hypothetical protein